MQSKLLKKKQRRARTDTLLSRPPYRRLLHICSLLLMQDCKVFQPRQLLPNVHRTNVVPESGASMLCSALCLGLWRLEAAQSLRLLL